MESKLTIDEFGTKRWKLANGVSHREYGPAIETLKGIKAWYINGIKHRKDGPAIEYNDGSEEWWLGGKKHREYGPAVQWNKYKYWYLDDIRYTEKEHKHEIRSRKLKQLLK